MAAKKTKPREAFEFRKMHAREIYTEAVAKDLTGLPITAQFGDRVLRKRFDLLARAAFEAADAFEFECDCQRESMGG